MGFPDDFINPILSCQTAGTGHSMQWPSVNGPGGLPNMLLCTFGSMMAGVNFVLDFIPPDPLNLPTPPSPLIFVDAFLGSLNMPGDIGEIDFSLVVPGGPTIPATGTDIQFDQSGMIKMILVTAMVPFFVIKGIVDKIISDLKVELPTVETIEGVFNTLALSVGISGAAIGICFGCIAQALFDLITALIPV